MMNSNPLYAYIAAVCALLFSTTVLSCDEQVPVQYRLRQILVEPTVSAGRETALLNMAKDCLVRASAGEDFVELARALSTEPGASQTGGDLGFFRYPDMVQPFSDAVFSMKPGDIRGPVTTHFGYHIIKLIAIRGETRHARHILFMLTPGKEDTLATMRTLQAARARLLKGESFDSVLADVSSNELLLKTQGYMVWQRPSDMLEPFGDIARNLPQGGISEPFVSPIGLHIVVVDSINYDSSHLFEGLPPAIERTLSDGATGGGR